MISISGALSPQASCLTTPALTPRPRLLDLVARLPIPVLALILTVGQAAFTLLLTGHHSVGASYRSLLEWDAQWYASILDEGYQCDVASLTLCNCAFFPGLPVLALPLKCLGLPTWLALPLVAQFCCWGFWTYLLLLLRLWDVHPRVRTGAVLALLTYPWSFFLQVGYSEAPFLLFLTGFLYWSEKPGKGSWLLAALHGAGMTGTRLVGVAALVWPFLRGPDGLSRFWREPLTWLWRRRGDLLLAAAASLGIVLFYSYLGWRFGRPDLYHTIQRTGMGVRPDYLVFLRWNAYIPRYTNGLVCPIILLGGVWLAWREWRLPDTPPGARCRTWALLTVAGMLFYLVMAGMITRQLCSLPRIGYPVIVLLLLTWAQQTVRLPRRPLVPSRWRGAALALVIGVNLTCVALQAHFVQRFIHRYWVA